MGNECDPEQDEGCVLVCLAVELLPPPDCDDECPAAGGDDDEAAGGDQDEKSLSTDVAGVPARVARSAEPGNKKKKSLKKGKGKNRKNKGKKQLKNRGKKSFKKKGIKKA